MKRLFKTLFLLLLVIMPITFASAKKTTTTTEAASGAPSKVTMYVFYGSTCPHCQELEEYIASTLKKDARVKDYLEVKYYEVWENTTNASFMTALGSSLGVEVKGVPFIVIGQKYFSGYGSTMNEEIVNTIVDQKNNAKYVDVVAELVKATGAQLTESNPEPSSPEDDKNTTKKNNIIGIIILVVTIAVIVVIIFTRHPEEDYEEEVEETEDDEESDETVKATSTKASKKKTTKKR